MLKSETNDVSKPRERTPRKRNHDIDARDHVSAKRRAVATDARVGIARRREAQHDPQAKLARVASHRRFIRLVTVALRHGRRLKSPLGSRRDAGAWRRDMAHKKQPPPSLGQGGGKNLGNTGKPCLPSPAPNCKHAALSNRLPILADEIVRYHLAGREAFASAAEYAIKAGEALIEAKKLVKHGDWLPWLRANCKLSERTAQLYMRIAAGKEELAKKRRCCGFEFTGCCAFGERHHLRR